LDDLRPDEALIRAAQDGEREAASALVERYYPRVRSFVSYLTNGRSNAEDLTQEVFARALGALGRFDGREGTYRFEPWLLRIAKNLVIDEARRRVHQPEVTDPSELPEMEPVPVSMDNVWDSVSQQLSTSTVKAALQRLPLRQRTVLVLREIEEMAYADIAQVVGTNVRGVEATLRRARARFRIEVANLESDEAHAAVCRRTLRLITSEDVGGAEMPEETSQHLSRCPECRGKVTSVRKVDRLFAALPPVAFVAPSWHAKVLANLPGRSVRGAPKGSFLELLRSSVTHVAALPVAQFAEAAATVAIAAVVATAPAMSSPASLRVDPTPVVSAQQVPA
ncbi:MAG: RNA polymerase sigma factor, partial [Nocardioidaceae bacterium]